MKVKNVYIFFTLLIVLFGNNLLFSQLICNTITPNTYYSYAESRTQIINSTLPQGFVVSPPQIDKTLSLAIHISKDSLGATNIDLNDLYDEKDILNILFKPIKLSFNICSIDTLDNFQYDELMKYDIDTDTITEFHMVSANNIADVINIYVLKYTSGDGKTKDNYIILAKESIKTLPHFIGHIFGLIHTGGNGNNPELVNGSNCLIAGDFVCDTEADTHRPIWANGNCELRTPLKDQNNEWYTVPSDNYMSKYKNCYTRFTPFQYRIIAYEYFLNLTHLK